SFGYAVNAINNNTNNDTIDGHQNDGISYYNETKNENNPPELNSMLASGLVAGVLDEETIEKNVSRIGKIADGSSHAYLTLTLPGFGLRDISILSNYRNFQRIELPCNDIVDLSPLGELPYLLELDVSNNKIRKLLDFVPPYNQISKIDGLKNCYRLQHLSIAHNLITTIEELDNLPLKYLNLRSNQITTVENLDTLQYLQHLNLSCNNINSLNGFPERLNFLEVLDLADNQFQNLSEIDHLSELRLLRDLSLQRNKVTEIDDYRLSVIFKLPQLTSLDRRKIDAVEKVEAKQMFNPTLEYFASRDHMTNIVFSFLPDHRVQESTLPNIETPYPMLILSGPDGCGRIELAHRLVEEFSEFFGYGILHTAREKRSNEKDRVDYIFIKQEQYEEDVTRGEFLCCYEYYGDWHGLQRSSVENVAKEGLACGLLSIKQSHFEPRCLLLLPMDKKIHKKRLQNLGFGDSEITIAISRVEKYAEYNRTHPGFFDSFICTNSLDDGYEQLRELVISYLGLEDDRLEAPRPHTSDEIRRFDDIDIQRSDSFLPSTNATGCRNSSHPSVDTPINQTSAGQNIRVKFGSAPAQIQTSEFKLRLSAKSRLKDLFQANNTSTKDQLRRQLSRTVPLIERKSVRSSNGKNPETNDSRNHNRSSKSAPTHDIYQLSLQSPDSSIANEPDDLLLDRASSELRGELDDAISIRS
ncbi:unnamed protein product, partial [Didymodactylos carnosus]